MKKTVSFLCLLLASCSVNDGPLVTTFRNITLHFEDFDQKYQNSQTQIVLFADGRSVVFDTIIYHIPDSLFLPKSVVHGLEYGFDIAIDYNKNGRYDKPTGTHRSDWQDAAFTISTGIIESDTAVTVSPDMAYNDVNFARPQTDSIVYSGFNFDPYVDHAHQFVVIDSLYQTAVATKTIDSLPNPDFFVRLYNEQMYRGRHYQLRHSIDVNNDQTFDDSEQQWVFNVGELKPNTRIEFSYTQQAPSLAAVVD